MGKPVVRGMPNDNRHLDTAVDLLSTVSTSLHQFLPASSSLHAAALLTAKQILDPLAQDVAESQQLRRDENRRKRKRGEQDGDVKVLQIREVYIKGFGAEQIWEQARRVTDAAVDDIEEDLAKLFQHEQADLDSTKELPTSNGDGHVKTVRFEDEGFEIGSGEELDSEADDVNGILDGQDDYEGEDLMEMDVEDIEEGGEEKFLSSDDGEKAETFIPDPNGLNDGFFSIDDFNKQSHFLEQKDAHGEEDNPSDEDEIDWEADPLAVPLSKTRPGKVGELDEADDDDDDGEEDGPTFGIADLDASDSDAKMDDDEADEGMMGLGNTNDIQYADFYEPPPKKPSKTKRMRALPKTQPPTTNSEDAERDIQRAMADVRRDLLNSDEEVSDGEESNASDNGQKSKSTKDKNLSTHEKQQAAIAAEIRKLEAAAVAKREWTLSGEARAADRPMNSLIEEDLEFERAGKPVPVITAEISESIEALIKRRIIAREFDEVIRRRPEALGSASDARRGRIELNDSQSKQGLAEIYEDEHLARTDPNYVDKLDAKTKKAHAEIDRLWKEVSGQLDVLSNLHFKPKRAEVEIKTVEDKPTIRMEDARPGGVAGEENMLAPQEIFRAGEGAKEEDIVIRKSGASANKEEMSREEKLRRRRRAKERGKKASGNKIAAQASRPDKKKSKKDEKSDILTELRKGNVKIIGKKGELEELGKRKKGSGGGESGITSSAFKL